MEVLSEPYVFQRVLLPPTIFIKEAQWPSLFWGCVAARGALYLVPFMADVVLKLDASSGALTVVADLRPDRSVRHAREKFANGVLVGAAIYFIPYNADHIGRLDLDAGQFDRIALPDNIPNTVSLCTGGGQDSSHCGKFSSAVADSAGRIYMSPWHVDYITVFTPGITAATGTFTQVGSPRTKERYHSSLYTQGAVYLFSQKLITKVVYDGTQDVVQNIPMNGVDFTNFGVVLLAGSIVLMLPVELGRPKTVMPWITFPGTESGKFDISTGQVTFESTLFEHLMDTARDGYGGVAANGRIFMVPRSSGDVVVLS